MLRQPTIYNREGDAKRIRFPTKRWHFVKDGLLVLAKCWERKDTTPVWKNKLNTTHGSDTGREGY